MYGKMTMYTMTQLAVTSQNGKLLNFFKSLRWNLSSSLRAACTLSFLAAHRSIQASKNAITSEKQQTMKPKNNAFPTVAFSAIASTIGPLIADPILLTLRLIPKAKDSSLP